MTPKPNSELYTRFVVLCCHFWPALTPPECRRQLDTGEITVEDFMAALELEAITSPMTVLCSRPVVMDWLFPESETQKSKKASKAALANFESLLMMAKPADEKSREKLEAAKRAILERGKVENGKQ